MNSTTEDRWLSVDEIAAYLGIKRDTVYNWIERKSMKDDDDALELVIVRDM